jgi:hypothetical protein
MCNNHKIGTRRQEGSTQLAVEIGLSEQAIVGNKENDLRKRVFFGCLIF